jgi:hypothetical protein
LALSVYLSEPGLLLLRLTGPQLLDGVRLSPAPFMSDCCFGNLGRHIHFSSRIISTCAATLI